MNWIKCSERLPPKDGRAVLGFVPSRSGYVARQDMVPVHWSGWGGGCWETLGGGHLLDWELTYWMPLPEPPNG